MTIKHLKMTKEEYLARAKELFGDDPFEWRFICPSCGHVQAIKDFRPFKDKGATPETARFNCIGRYDGHGFVDIGTKPGPCNYTSGGLINLNPITVTDGDQEWTSFAFDDSAAEAG